MKKVNSFAYQVAIAILRNEIDPINTVELNEEDIGLILPSKAPSPESVLIRKEAYNNLSSEAKEVLDTVLDGPAEVLQFFVSPIKKQLNVKRIQKYFSDRWCSPFLSEQTIEEIKKWAKSL